MAQQSSPQIAAKACHCNVVKLRKTMNIDANWNKAQWKKIKLLVINNFIRELPAFKLEVRAKMQYDDANLYVIFQVKDR